LSFEGAPGKRILLAALVPGESMSAPLEALRRLASERVPLPLIAPVAFLAALPGRPAIQAAATALEGGFIPGIPMEAGAWLFLPLNPGRRWEEARAAFASSVMDGFLPSFPGLLLGKGRSKEPGCPPPSLLGAWTLDVIAFHSDEDGPDSGCSWETVVSRRVRKPERGSRGGPAYAKPGS
jgi:hypothetical protein